MNDWTARAAPANTPPPPPQPLKPEPEPEPGVGRRLLSVPGGQPPSGGPPPSSSGRNSPANLPPPDDAAAAVARVASEFRALERLRAVGYDAEERRAPHLALALARVGRRAEAIPMLRAWIARTTDAEMRVAPGTATNLM